MRGKSWLLCGQFWYILLLSKEHGKAFFDVGQHISFSQGFIRMVLEWFYNFDLRLLSEPDPSFGILPNGSGISFLNFQLKRHFDQVNLRPDSTKRYVRIIFPCRPYYRLVQRSITCKERYIQADLAFWKWPWAALENTADKSLTDHKLIIIAFYLLVFSQ